MIFSTFLLFRRSALLFLLGSGSYNLDVSHPIICHSRWNNIIKSKLLKRMITIITVLLTHNFLPLFYQDKYLCPSNFRSKITTTWQLMYVTIFFQFKIYNYSIMVSSVQTFLLFLILLLQSLIRQTQQQSFSGNISPKTINTISTYRFSIIDPTLLSNNGSINIVFPAGKFTLTTISCFNTENSAITYPCTVSGGNTVVINSNSGSGTPYLQLSISQVLNPGSKQSLFFTYNFKNTANTILSTLSTTIEDLQPDTLTSCSIFFTPSVVHTQSTATITITTKNFLQANGSIEVKFPDIWTQASSANYSPLISPFVCSRVGGSILKSAFTCDAYSGILSLSNCFAVNVNSGSTIIFSISKIRTPPTTLSNHTATVTTQMALGGSLVDRSTTCSVSGVSQQNIAMSLNLGISFIVGSQNSLSFSWITGSPLRTGDIINIVLPTSYMAFTQTNSSLFYYDSKFISRSVLSGNSSTQIRFNITGLSSDPQITVGQKIQISNIIVQNFVDVSPRSINVILSRSGFNIASGSLTITPNPNNLLNTIITSDISIVSSPMTLNFTFSTFNSLQVNSTIKIQIPTSISISNTPTCNVISAQSSAISSGIICSISSNLLTVSSFLLNTLNPGTITLIVSNVFSNPITTEPTTTFVIGTYSSANFLIDQNINSTYTSTPATIGNLTITPSSFQVQSISTYTIDYTISRKIKQGSTITIITPPQITTSPSSSYTYSLNNGAQVTVSPSSINTVNGSTTIVFSSIIASELVSGNNLKIRLINMINPSSLATTSSFQVQVRYNNYLTESLRIGLSITMTTMAQFKELIPLITGPKNGDQQDYTFYIKPAVAISAGSLLALQIVDNTNNTNQISFKSGSIICQISFDSTIFNNPCTVTGSILNINLGGSLSDTSGITQYRLVVSKFILARTPKASSNFRFTSYNSGGFGVQTSTVSSLVNTLNNLIKQLSLSILSTPSQLNSYQQLKITIKTWNGLNLLAGEYFVIQIPTSFKLLGSTSTSLCVLSTTFNCTLFNNNQNAIKVSASLNYLTVGLVKDFVIILNEQIYVSPTSFQFSTDYFYVTTYTDNNLVIDATNPILIPQTKAVFYRSCQGKCFKCLGSNNTFCQSCYASGSGIIPNVTYGGFNIKTSDNQCVDLCGIGFYILNGDCLRCQSPCQNCLTQTQCSSCVSGYYYVSVNPPNNRCQLSCPIGYYNNSLTNNCDQCSSSCYQCSQFPNFCISCNGSNYLSGSLCVLSCPDGFYQNITTNKCQPCDVGCFSTCGISAIDCTACKAGYYRFSVNSTQCVNSCPTGSVIDISTGVCTCSSSCRTCSGLLTTCTSCNSGFLYQSACIFECPSMTYQPPTSSTCQRCIDQSCSKCNNSNPTICLMCQSSYYLYLGSCRSSCPEGTRIENQDCVICPTGCKGCLNSAICTSCFVPFLKQTDKCVSDCSASYVNFNAVQCVSECPAGYFNQNGKCQINSNTTNNNTNNNTNTTVNQTQSVGRIIPFPYTIAYAIMFGISIGLKCFYAPTLLASTIMSFGSVLEIFSILTLIIVSIVGLGSFVAGTGLLIAGLALVYVSNIIALIMIVKVLHNDNKFMLTYRKKTSSNILIRIISVITYHKFHEIVFSNIFGIKVFSNKVDFVRRLYPFNILLLVSILFSILIIIGAGLVGFEVQSLLLTSATFIQSIDCIIIVILNLIPTILVLRRKDTLYEQDLDDREVKRYQTQDQLNMNNDNGDIEQIFIEEGGDTYGKGSKLGQSRKNYYYQNSRRTHGGQDPYQTPLDKKRTSTANPITGTGNQIQKSSESLFQNDKSKTKARLINPVDEISEQIQEIKLDEPSRDNLIPKKSNRKQENQSRINKDEINPMINYTGYDLDPALLQLNESSDEFKKLPSQIKAKIRLAKANMQINKNGKNLKRTIQDQDFEQIQLSPKKNNKQQIDKNSIDQNIDSSGSGLVDSQRKKNNQSPTLNKSKSKQKEKSKQKSKSKSKSKQKKSKSPGKNLKILETEDKNQTDQDKQDQERLARNQSEQMNKKDLTQGLKTTKSQNIKGNKKKVNSQIKITFNKDNKDGLKKSNQGKDKSKAKFNDVYLQEEDEPTMPVYKNRSKGKRQDQNLYQSDSMDQKQEGKNKVPKISSRKSQNFQDKKLNNLRAINGERTIPNQNPDDLPHIHSTEQLSNLVILNRKLQKQKSGDIQFSNDDQSIYKKIYNDNDDQQTLKSVQGDNFFGNQVSPSQFNLQNQRFESNQFNNDMPVIPTMVIDQDEKVGESDGEKNEDDGFDQQQYEPHMRRYQSNKNIDYDSVLSKKLNNDRIKELEKIYLPRLEVIKPKRKKK